MAHSSSWSQMEMRLDWRSIEAEGGRGATARIYPRAAGSHSELLTPSQGSEAGIPERSQSDKPLPRAALSRMETETGRGKRTDGRRSVL